MCQKLALLVARSTSPVDTWGGSECVVNSGTEMTSAVYEAIHQMWYASSIDIPMYVCRLLSTSSEGWCLVVTLSMSFYY